MERQGMVAYGEDDAFSECVRFLVKATKSMNDMDDTAVEVNKRIGTIQAIYGRLIRLDFDDARFNDTKEMLDSALKDGGNAAQQCNNIQRQWRLYKHLIDDMIQSKSIGSKKILETVTVMEKSVDSCTAFSVAMGSCLSRIGELEVKLNQLSVQLQKESEDLKSQASTVKQKGIFEAAILAIGVIGELIIGFIDRDILSRAKKIVSEETTACIIDTVKESWKQSRQLRCQSEKLASQADELSSLISAFRNFPIEFDAAGQLKSVIDSLKLGQDTETATPQPIQEQTIDDGIEQLRRIMLQDKTKQ